MSAQKFKTVLVTLENYKKLEDSGKETCRSRSGMANFIINEYFKKEEKK